MGDFNEVLHAHEHHGVGSRSQAQMDAFRDALDTCGLTDIGYTGRSWTWEKKVAGGTYIYKGPTGQMHRHFGMVQCIPSCDLGTQKRAVLRPRTSIPLFHGRCMRAGPTAF